MLLCFSCIEKFEVSLLMDDVETLYVANLDSAQYLLDEVEFLISDDSDFARWCLLSGKIEDERDVKRNTPSHCYR